MGYDGLWPNAPGGELRLNVRCRGIAAGGGAKLDGSKGSDGDPSLQV